jgi:hypothetical protein
VVLDIDRRTAGRCDQLEAQIAGHRDDTAVPRRGVAMRHRRIEGQRRQTEHRHGQQSFHHVLHLLGCGALGQAAPPGLRSDQ